MDRDLALQKARVTETADPVSAHRTGRGGYEATEVAIKAMRSVFPLVYFDPTVVQSKSEQDHMTVFYPGERVGCGEIHGRHNPAHGDDIALTACSLVAQQSTETKRCIAADHYLHGKPR